MKDQIEQLEKRIDELIQLCLDLGRQNGELLDARNAMVRDQARLAESHLLAKEKLQTVVKRLQSLR